MITRVFRVTTDKDIKRVLKLGRRFSAPEFSLHTLQNTLNHPRMCVIVASGVSKKAVVRNRLKRQVRESLRLLIKEGKIGYTIDMVVVVRPGFIKVEDSTRQQFFSDFLKKIGLI